MFARHHYLSGSLSPAARCYLAMWNQTPVAFCAVLPLIGRRNHRRISRLVTLPDFQGIGIGMRLAEAVAEIHREQGHCFHVTASHPALDRSLPPFGPLACETVDENRLAWDGTLHSELSRFYRPSRGLLRIRGYLRLNPTPVAKCGRPPVLDQVKRGQICAILAVGSTRTVAARYVGCAVSTIRATAIRDPEFLAQLQHAESRHEVGHLQAIQAAATSGKYCARQPGPSNASTPSVTATVIPMWLRSSRWPGCWPNSARSLRRKSLRKRRVNGSWSDWMRSPLTFLPKSRERQVPDDLPVGESEDQAQHRAEEEAFLAGLEVDSDVAGRWSRRVSETIRQHGALPKARRGESGLLSWARHHLPNHFTLEPSLMHRWLARQLDHANETLGLKLNVIGPRGGAKSTIGTLAWPLFLALEGREPYVWIISDTRHQACAHLENIKAELIDNPRLAADYPRAVGRGPTWRANSIGLANGVVIQAFGTGQRIRGRRYRAHRPTTIICDDLQNDQHIESAQQREYSRRWFHGTLLKAGTKRTKVLNLATALHHDALAMELHRTPGWTSKAFRAIERWPDQMLQWLQWEAIYTDRDNPARCEAAREFYETHRAEMEQGAVLLWPAQEDLYTLMCMRTESGRTAFEREKQSSPIQSELCEWPESYFESLAWFEAWPSDLRLKTMALDPSKGQDARRGDYSAFVLLGIDAQGTCYIEADLARRPTPQIVADGVALYRRFRPDAFGIEANQFQDLLGAAFAEEFLRQGLPRVQPWTITNQINKTVRIRRLGPYLATRQLRFKAESPATRLLLEQLKAFPLGDHDDGPDALEMSIRLAIEILGTPPSGDGLGSHLPVGGP